VTVYGGHPQRVALGEAGNPVESDGDPRHDGRRYRSQAGHRSFHAPTIGQMVPVGSGADASMESPWWPEVIGPEWKPALAMLRLRSKGFSGNRGGEVRATGSRPRSRPPPSRAASLRGHGEGRRGARAGHSRQPSARRRSISSGVGPDLPVPAFLRPGKSAGGLQVVEQLELFASVIESLAELREAEQPQSRLESSGEPAGRLPSRGDRTRRR